MLNLILSKSSKGVAEFLPIVKRDGDSVSEHSCFYKCVSVRQKETERVSGLQCVNPRSKEGSVGLWLTSAPRSPQTDSLIESPSRPHADNRSLVPLSLPGLQSEKQHSSQGLQMLCSVCCLLRMVKGKGVQDSFFKFNLPSSLGYLPEITIRKCKQSTVKLKYRSSLLYPKTNLVAREHKASMLF